MTTCALGAWQHSTPTELHQLIDSAGRVVDTLRNRANADRIANAKGYTVKTVQLSDYLNQKQGQ